MANRNFFMQIGNPFMQLLLRSPLHRLLSKNFMLITVTGRSSRKKFTTPVNFWREGDTLGVISFRQRTWWRNLRGSAPVMLQLEGKQVAGHGTVLEDERAVAGSLAAYLRQNPGTAKYFHVNLDSSGQPREQEIAAAAGTRVVVQVKLA